MSNEFSRGETEVGTLQVTDKSDGRSGAGKGEHQQNVSISTSLQGKESDSSRSLRENGEEGKGKQRASTENARENRNLLLNFKDKSSLENLSLDLLAWLLSYLTIPEIAAASLVAKRLHRACRSNDLWKLKFQGRWNLSAGENPGQNWYLAYQEAYQNPHDLWIFHWNCVYPQDGLVPGRCCIYDVPNLPPMEEHGKQRHQACPHCRFFPEHPLSTSLSELESSTTGDKETSSPTECMARATDETLRNFFQQHQVGGTPPMAYERQRALTAFSSASTFHRTLDTQQYTSAHPHHESSCTYLSPLKDLLFFNVTEEPMCTKQGAREVEHLRRERELQQQWEAEQNPRSRRHSEVFWKPGYETAHHTWHQALVTNPDFVRPIVFRVSAQRPDCFTVFPSEGYLEPGQTIVITFGVRPLGSLLASLFETINVQRTDAEEWVNQVWNEEGPLPCTPFVIRYKYSSVIPCIPARGFIPPHLPHPLRQQEVPGGQNSANAAQQDRNDGGDAEGSADNDKLPSVADVCWKQKELIDYHWSGGDPRAIVESHEVRNIYLSAHVNANYPFSQFCHDTLTPFDVSIGSSTTTDEMATPMLYYAAPQLHEFYTTSVFPLLQNVKLEQEVTHAGQVFRNHRQKCVRCRRSSWGPRLEEMGQAYVLARLESFVMVTRQKMLLQNCELIVRCADDLLKKYTSGNNTENAADDMNQQCLVRIQQLLYVVYNTVQQFRAASYLEQKQRRLLIKLENLADYLYGECSDNIESSGTKFPWRQSGIYRYGTCTDSIFCSGQSEFEEENGQVLGRAMKAEPQRLDSFRCLAQTPGLYDLGPQEDPNHLGELVPTSSIANRYRRQQKGIVTDMFMDDPLCSLQSALIILHDPRSVAVHGVYDRIPYPGKVVRRPRFPFWFTDTGRHVSKHDIEYDAAAFDGKTVYFILQDTMNLEAFVEQSSGAHLLPISMRRYLRNVPSPGIGRFPLSIDKRVFYLMPEAIDAHEEQLEESDSVAVETKAGPKTNTDVVQPQKGSASPSFKTKASSFIISLPLPASFEDTLTYRTEIVSDAHSPLTGRPQSDGVAENPRNAPPRAVNDAVANNLNFIIGGGNLNGAPPLLRGPGPRLLSLLWSVSAQLGWTADDVGQGAASVFLNRQLLIGLQWLSLTFMAGPLFWTLCARYVEWIPCKPVDYVLEDLPFQLTNEMRFLNEQECGACAFLVFILWVFLGRWTERWTSRGYFRAMLEHVSSGTSTRFTSRLFRRYKRRWDAICPQFLQRLTFTPHWNRRSFDDLIKHIAFWRSNDFREHGAIFPAELGRGLMFWGGRWDEINVKTPSSRNLVVLALVVALGSFLSSTPNFWMNLLMVFSCSISLGLNMSLSSLEAESSGMSRGGAGAMKSLNLPSLVAGSFLIGQLLGSSGGVLFLAEFVVTSISFVLGGAGTISASSVASWGCFFGLSCTAFWGYLFGRVALIDAIIRQKRRVHNKGYSSVLLCASLTVVFVLWILMFLWRWEVPVSLMIVRPNFLKSAPSAGAAATTDNMVAHSAARKYAAKHLQ